MKAKENEKKIMNLLISRKRNVKTEKSDKT